MRKKQDVATPWSVLYAVFVLETEVEVQGFASLEKVERYVTRGLRMTMDQVRIAKYKVEVEIG